MPDSMTAWLDQHRAGYLAGDAWRIASCVVRRFPHPRSTWVPYQPLSTRSRETY